MLMMLGVTMLYFNLLVICNRATQLWGENHNYDFVLVNIEITIYFYSGNNAFLSYYEHQM